VIIGDGTKLQAIGVGTVLITNHENETIELKNVWVVPKLRYNLISVKGLSDKYEVKFKRNSVHVSDGTKTILTSSRNSKSALYEFSANPSHEFAMIVEAISPKLWHRRLGHLNYFQIANTENLVEGMHVEKFNQKDTKCESCIFGKHHLIISKYCTVCYSSTKQNLADILTKQLPMSTFTKINLFY